MTSFLDFILNETRTDPKSELRSIIQKKLGKENIRIASKHKYEICRAHFGVTADDVISNIKNILKGIDFKIATDNSGNPIYLKNLSSGDYKSLVIIYKGQELHLTSFDSEANDGKSGLTINRKQFTPNRILINIINDKQESTVYTSADSLKNSIDSSKLPKNIILLLTEIFNNIKNRIKNSITEDESVPAFSEKDIPSFLNSLILNNGGSIKIPITDKLMTLLNLTASKDINIIANDLGEIILPYIILTTFKDANVSYPSKSNEKLVDFFVNGAFFSAKAGKGSAPSGTEPFALVLKKKNEDKTLLFTKEEIKFIDDFNNLYKENTFEMYRDLIKNYLFSIKTNAEILKPIVDFFDDTKIYSFKDYKSYINELNKLDQNKIIDLIMYINENLSKVTKNNVHKLNKDKVKNKWNDANTTDANKAGYIIYPLVVGCINILNNSKYKELLTTTFNKGILLFLSYLTINSYIKIKIKLAEKAKWHFSTGNLSTPNPYNSKLPVEME